jgi:hypothetical protein
LPALKALGMQCLVGSLEILNRRFQVVTRANDRFFGLPLRSTQEPDKKVRHDEHQKSGRFRGLWTQCMDRLQKVIMERESGERRRQQAWPDSTVPSTQQDDAEK